MNNLSQNFKLILSEISDVQVDSIALQKLLSAIQEVDAIFLDGRGRSGLVAKMFANRLSHLGLKPHVIGEVSCPPIQTGDLYLIISGSGNSSALLENLRRVHKLGGKTAVVTTNTNSKLAQETDISVLIPTDTKFSKERTSKQPMGALFEQTAFITLETAVLSLAQTLGRDENFMEAHHANIE
ncbi:SIS domain-containing protein [Sporolactobacillus sp. STSJ-5]|uniref:6-phospho-3-hexuloisomerase n=1 Tax=Sporolactobacillus sp. STSJ-5 TaxID=2965076 RepID=UPI002106C59E|nr:SIS domain-containing protein [Sporolactobacillus sp. STSJ-5]